MEKFKKVFIFLIFVSITLMNFLILNTVRAQWTEPSHMGWEITPMQEFCGYIFYVTFFLLILSIVSIFIFIVLYLLSQRKKDISSITDMKKYSKAILVFFLIIFFLSNILSFSYNFVSIIGPSCHGVLYGYGAFPGSVIMLLMFFVTLFLGLFSVFKCNSLKKIGNEFNFEKIKIYRKNAIIFFILSIISIIGIFIPFFYLFIYLRACRFY